MKHLLRKFSNISHIPDFQTFLNKSLTVQTETPEKKTLEGLKYFIQTYGCQMNENDSEIVSGILSGAGLQISQSPEDV